MRAFAGMIISICIVACFVDESWAQDTLYDRVESDIEQSIRNGSVDEVTDPEERAIELEDMQINPINVNTAPADALLRIPGLSVQLVRNILNYRKTKGPIESIDDLLNVKGIGKVTLSKIQSFIRAGGNQMYHQTGYWVQHWKMDMSLRYRQTVQKSAGYLDVTGGKGYAGSPAGIDYQIDYKSRHLDMFWRQSKDPGETMDGKFGFDFTSGHLAIKNAGWIRSFVIGDYKISAGQGLILWNGYSFGGGISVVESSGRTGNTLKASGSGDENRFFRGMGISLGKKLRVTTFWSRRKWSARLAGGDSVHMPDMSGLYRTLTERSRRYNTGFVVTGGRISWNMDAFQMGLNVYRAIFDKYLLRGSNLYQDDDFEGKRASAISLDYRWIWQDIYLFGEIARSLNGYPAIQSGLDYDFGSHTNAVFIYRNYSRRFQSIFGNALAQQGGSPQNEQGWYMGFKYDFERLKLESYGDLFVFPGPSYYSSESSGGFESGFSATLRLWNDSKIELSGTSGKKLVDTNEVDNEGRTIIRQTVSNREKLDVHLIIKGGALTSRSEAGVTRTRISINAWNYGMMLSQGMRWNIAPWLYLDGNVMLFDTDNYDARVYEYEFSLPGLFPIPSFYGQGQRTYLMIRITALRRVDFWIRYGVTTYENRRSIGSGLDEINGNRKSSIGIAMRLRLND